MTTINYYIDQAEAFAKKWGVRFGVYLNETEYKKYFHDDTKPRYIFKCHLSRYGEHYFFDFGQSLAEGNKVPNLYDVLACLQKYDCGSFEEFCKEFGYDLYNDECSGYNRKAMKIYKACTHEYNAVCRLFGDSGECYKELCEIN